MNVCIQKSYYTTEKEHKLLGEFTEGHADMFTTRSSGCSTETKMALWSEI